MYGLRYEEYELFENEVDLNWKQNNVLTSSKRDETKIFFFKRVQEKNIYNVPNYITLTHFFVY